MASYNQDWDDLGKSIQDIVDQAVNSRNFQKLDQTIRQVINRVVDVGGEVVRGAVDSVSGTSPKAAGAYQQTKQTSAPQKNLPVLYGSTDGKTVKAVVKIAGGALLALVTLLMLLSSAVLDLLLAGFSLMIVPVVLALMGFGAGVWLLDGGLSTMKMISRFKVYRRTLGQNTHCTLEKLARSVGKSVKFVRKELQKMIAQGYFLQGHLDREQKCLITSDETYQHYERSRLQLEQRQKEEAAAAAQKKSAAISPQVQEVLDRGDAFIAEIRRCNDAIPGEEISAKIDRMEQIVRRIFERAKSHPEIVPDLKKMMDYYLPMTVKLLNAYADMDAQPIQGQTIQNSKREIEATLDTLNLAFEKLLDSVFHDTALDVSSDISVLNTLLAQEGLTEDELSKLKNQNT